jgi:hypothetical protein
MDYRIDSLGKLTERRQQQNTKRLASGKPFFLRGSAGLRPAARGTRALPNVACPLHGRVAAFPG